MAKAHEFSRSHDLDKKDVARNGWLRARVQGRDVLLYIWKQQLNSYTRRDEQQQPVKDVSHLFSPT